MFKDLVKLSEKVQHGVITKAQAVPLKDWLIEHPEATYKDMLMQFGYMQDVPVPLVETLDKIMATGDYDLKDRYSVKPIVKRVMQECSPKPNPILVERFIKKVLMFD